MTSIDMRSSSWFREKTKALRAFFFGNRTRTEYTHAGIFCASCVMISIVLFVVLMY